IRPDRRVAVGGGLDEAVEERRLVVQRARAVAQNTRGVAERGRVDRRDVTEAGVHILWVEDDRADGVEGLLDLRIAELDVVAHPVVVDLGAGLAKNEVLDPVGSGPAGRGIRAEADAPRRA